VQLGRAADVVERLGLQPEPDRDARGELSDVADVVAQVGLALVQDLQQRVAGRLGDRVAAALELLGVQALVGELERGGPLVGLEREPGGAVRAADVEAVRRCRRTPRRSRRARRRRSRVVAGPAGDALDVGGDGVALARLALGPDREPGEVDADGRGAARVEQGVGAALAGEEIGAAAAVEDVVAVVAAQGLVAVAAGQHVVAAVAVEQAGAVDADRGAVVAVAERDGDGGDRAREAARLVGGDLDAGGAGGVDARAGVDEGDRAAGAGADLEAVALAGAGRVAHVVLAADAAEAERGGLRGGGGEREQAEPDGERGGETSPCRVLRGSFLLPADRCRARRCEQGSAAGSIGLTFAGRVSQRTGFPSSLHRAGDKSPAHGRIRPGSP
jgi:hypothetical protein